MRARRIIYLIAVSMSAVSAACSSPAPAERTSSADAQKPPAAVSSQMSQTQLPRSSSSLSTIAPDLPVLPPGIETGARPPQVIRAAYEFAARHPEVLSYMPCFCGCERGGHRNNDDCFVAKRNAKGEVTEWMDHGMVCEICLDVATQVAQMHRSGASLTEIRETIEREFARPGGNHTPTPMPPRSGHSHD